MISIIICSRYSDIPTKMRQNIAETIGCDHELLVVDNSRNKYSIFQAYNEGVRRSKGDILCFVHEDVLFRSMDWGRVIAAHFWDDEKVGLIGFAGAHFFPDIPMYWDRSPMVSEYNLTTRGSKTERCFSVEHFGNETMVEVVAVDGLCFFMRRDLFDRVAFDENTFRGFHMYDLDISMQVRETGYKVCVCDDVLVEHFYEFNPSKAGFELFEANLQKFFDKWSSYFPLTVGLQGVTDGITQQLNRYVRRSIQLEKTHENTLQSKAYRLGKAVVHPLRLLKGHK